MDGDSTYIYRLVKTKGAKSKAAIQLTEYVKDTYKTLPFGVSLDSRFMASRRHSLL